MLEEVSHTHVIIVYCGGEDGMIKKTDYIKLKTVKIIKLKNHLNCKNFGIYAVQCNERGEYYVGKTTISQKYGVRTDTFGKIWLRVK